MSVVQDLLPKYQHVITSLTVTTGSRGVFDVTVDGDLLYSKHQTGRFANPGEVLELFVAKHAQDVRPFGS